MKSALVLGSGGFIGSHLVNRLKSEGYKVDGVDLKSPDFSKTSADNFYIHDLRDGSFPFTVSNYDEIYQLAADMGGAGFVFTGENDADIMHNSSMINLNILNELRMCNFEGRIFYSSSACMYPQEIQNNIKPHIRIGYGLKESDAYPANPDSEYGWEKLFSERLYLAYARNHGLDVRIARFHNIYGPEGTYKGGREKAPAAMCRKVVECAGKCLVNMYDCSNCDSDEGICKQTTIEVWGDGLQTRSFLYIDDCIDAVRLLMQSDFKEPINIGSEEMVSINALAQMAIDISGKSLKIKNVESNALGVRGRNSDNTLIRKVLGWEPKFTLRKGLELTHRWVQNQYANTI